MIEKRALYHLMHINGLDDPALRAEEWQKEDYRALSLQTLFDRLKSFSIPLDKESFLAHAEECDSPEMLTEHFIGERPLTAHEEDKLYLVVFELWRRLLPENPSVSVICNELDHCIHLYDTGSLKNLSSLFKAIDRFCLLLNENADQGIPVQEVLPLVSTHCANDIETFFYDFLLEQIEEGDEEYARELIDTLKPYLSENKWFKLISLRLCEPINNKIGRNIIRDIVEEHLKENDFEYNLELLSMMLAMSDDRLFHLIAWQTIPLLTTEESFQDFLSITADYFRRTDREESEKIIQECLSKRSSYPLNRPLSQEDPAIIKIGKIFQPTHR